MKKIIKIMNSVVKLRLKLKIKLKITILNPFNKLKLSNNNIKKLNKHVQLNSKIHKLVVLTIL